MTIDSPVSGARPAELPVAHRNAVQAQLHSHENVLALLEVDLDARLHFVPGLLVLTDRRILSCAAAGSADASWQSWDFHPALRLQHHDHAGVGHIALCDASARLAHWCFTLGQNLQAIRLVNQFEALRSSAQSGHALQQPVAAVCPSCKAPLASAQAQCPVCTKAVHTPSSTWTLLRLWRFARPYRGQLLLGFVLMLLGTAASQVPPYLTIPLVDQVLIPFQNGQHIAKSTVAWYLSGLLGSGLLAWGLSWAKTFVLALVCGCDDGAGESLRHYCRHRSFAAPSGAIARPLKLTAGLVGYMRSPTRTLVEPGSVNATPWSPFVVR